MKFIDVLWVKHDKHKSETHNKNYFRPPGKPLIKLYLQVVKSSTFLFVFISFCFNKILIVYVKI